MISPARRRFLVSALLAFLVIAVYAPLSRYDFIALDDAKYVEDNPYVNGGFTWKGIKWAGESVVAGNWHPVTMLSHMADCQIYGLVAGGHHFTNVLLHTANTVLLFWLLLAMTEEKKPAAGDQQPERRGQKPEKRNLKSVAQPVSNIWPCALTAALFGLHPLHVESVAWIAERKDVLSAFFGLLTLLAYARYARAQAAPRPWFSSLDYYAALLLFALGLMSKSMLVTLPFVMLLLDYWPLRRIAGKHNQDRHFKAPNLGHVLIEKIPFFLLAAFVSVITFRVQKGAGAVVSLKYFSLSARLANAMVAYAHYLEKTVWPGSLAMLYPYHPWPEGQIIFSTALVAGISAVAIWRMRRSPYLFVGWFWFLGMLVPVIGIIQVGLQAMADHYTYLPLIGIFIAVAWGLAGLASSPSAMAVLPLRRALAVGSAALVGLLSVASAVQVRYWKNSETLFEHAVRVTDSNTVAHYILGAWFDSQGKTDKALNQFTQAIKDDPGNVKARCGLAYILCGRGDLDDAAVQYRTALEIAPDFAKAHFGLAEVLMKQRCFDEAIDEYSQALRADPDIAEAHYQLAGLYSARGDAAPAISHLEEAVQLAPDWPLALNNLAWMLATERDATLRNGPEAARLALRAATLTGGNNPSTLDTLAAAYAEAGHYADAVSTATRAIQDAGAEGQTNLVAQIASRLKLYQARRAYHE